MTQATVTALNVYPVKSMKAVPLQRAVLTPFGLEYDRRWMVVRDNGRFVTQREISRLALIQPRLADGRVELSLDGTDAIELPAEPMGEILKSAVWGDDCTVVSAGDAISDWLTDCLQSRERLHLVHMAPDFARPQNHPDRMGPDTTTVFADLAPVLVANEGSLAALNDELRTRALAPVPMNRFRPNVVVQGLDAFAEHDVGTLAGPHYVLHLRDRCERCVVTTIDQNSGIADPQRQPFRTLADINPLPGNPRSAVFGENATLKRGAGETIAVGDRLAVGCAQGTG